MLPGLIDIWEKRTYTEGWRENCRRKSRSLSRKTRGCCYAGKIDVVHFSPAGNTRKAALLLAQAMAGRTEEYDLTRPHNTGRSFGPGDVVIVAGPVYGGRLPAVMLERLAEIQGNGAFAVTLAVYGNRAYEDALIELDDSVESGMVQVHYAAWLFRKRAANVNETGMPRFLRYELNKRLMSQVMGGKKNDI